MKAFLINPVAKSVTEVEYTGKFEQAYGLMECSMIQFCYPLKNHILMVDEEGLFKTHQAHFLFDGDQYVGRAMLVHKHRYKDVSVSIEEVKALIQFS